MDSWNNTTHENSKDDRRLKEYFQNKILGIKAKGNAMITLILSLRSFHFALYLNFFMILFTVEILACPCGTRCIVPIVGGWGVCQPDKSCSRFNLNPNCNVGKYRKFIKITNIVA